MRLNISLPFLALTLALCPTLSSAQVAPKRPNVAVMAFDGDKTVTPEQLNFITGKFSGELVKTGAFSVLDRGKMEFILKEQGFQQTGICTSSECKVQMGQMLGVDNIVTGNMVKFGPEYAFRIEFIDVSSGQIQTTVELSEKGDLYEVYKIVCEDGAKKLAQEVYKINAAKAKPVQAVAATSPATTEASTATETPIVTSETTAVVPPDAIPAPAVSKPLSTKRKVALAMWGSAAGFGTLGFLFNRKAFTYRDQYDLAKATWTKNPTTLNADDYQASYDNMTTMQKGRNASYAISLTALVAGTVLWFLPEGK